MNCYNISPEFVIVPTTIGAATRILSKREWEPGEERKNIFLEIFPLRP